MKNTFYLLVLLLNLSACKSTLSLQTSNIQNISISSETQTNPKIEAIIAPYKVQIDAAMKKVIGHSVKELRCERTDLESPLGNFIVDLIRYQTAKIYDSPLDMCIVNNGGLRVPINKGNITVGNIFELMPFENEVMVLTITGKDLLTLFDFEAKFRKTSFSNTQLRFTEEGQLVSAKIGGKLLELDKTYKLVTYDYLANGGDMMNCFANVKKEPMGITLRSMILNHIEELQSKGEKIDANIEGRVIFRD